MNSELKAPTATYPLTHSARYWAAKRVLDIGTSLAGLLLLAIPLLLMAIAIKLDSTGPVFYLQKRAGKNGRPFNIVKFRTMVPNADRIGLGFEIAHDDPRITRVGRLLRHWSLDELPQLYNMLLGEMALVGPRPARMDQIQRFSTKEKERMLVKPGLTGWAQVNGRNGIDWKRRIELDLWYIAHESLWLDFKIVLKTIWITYVTHADQFGPEGVTSDYGA